MYRNATFRTLIVLVTHSFVRNDHFRHAWAHLWIRRRTGNSFRRIKECDVYQLYTRERTLSRACTNASMLLHLKLLARTWLIEHNDDRWKSHHEKPRKEWRFDEFSRQTKIQISNQTILRNERALKQLAYSKLDEFSSHTTKDTRRERIHILRKKYLTNIYK